MQEIEFNNLAQIELSKLYELLVRPSKYNDLDIELTDNIIYITLPTDRQYVINKHYPSRQIWLSSPVSGASYYNYDLGQNKFINKNQETLIEKILIEISSYE
jgi:frataxin